MNRIFIVSIFLICFFSTTYAQGVVVKEDYMVQRLMERYVELNRSIQRVDGWRIQLLATTDRRRMESSKEKFQAKYPNIPVAWVHASPYYKLRAGAYQKKLDAIRVLQLLKRDFPSAYPAQDKNINPVELLNSF